MGHSLGGTSLLIYAMLCGCLGVDHGVVRMVLLSPAGFHRAMPVIIRCITNTAAFVLKPAGETTWTRGTLVLLSLSPLPAPPSWMFV